MDNDTPPPPPPTTPHSIKKDGRTLLRQGLTPYLPPPVVKAMGDLDPLLEPYVGPEASITIASTLFFSFLVLQFLKVLGGLSRGGKAIADDEDDAGLAALNKTATEDYGDTVILCGPMWAGKTRIFYHLAHKDPNLPTLMSLRANAALLENDSKIGGEKAIRLLDYPGHSGLQDELFVRMIQAKPVRIVLVVDATQPMTAAADFLYDLIQHGKDLGMGKNKKLNIFVACHKGDLSSSKNPRRIKISLRTELEKLIKVRSTIAETAAVEDDGASSSLKSSSAWWKEEQSSLDLDELHYVRLRFESTTCSVADGIDTLADFLKTGAMK